MPNSAARIRLEQSIEAEKAAAVRRLKWYEAIAKKHRDSLKPGGAPLSVADLLEWHGFEQQEKASRTNAIEDDD